MDTNRTVFRDRSVSTYIAFEGVDELGVDVIPAFQLGDILPLHALLGGA